MDPTQNAQYGEGRPFHEYSQLRHGGIVKSILYHENLSPQQKAVAIERLIKLGYTYPVRWDGDSQGTHLALKSEQIGVSYRFSGFKDM